MHAAREADSSDERGQFVLYIAMVMKKLGIADWDGLVGVLKSVVWNEVVGERGWALARRDVESLVVPVIYNDDGDVG